MWCCRWHFSAICRYDLTNKFAGHTYKHPIHPCGMPYLISKISPMSNFHRTAVTHICHASVSDGSLPKYLLLVS